VQPDVNRLPASRANDACILWLAARHPSRLFEIALVFVRLDHVARFIVNADHGIM
jgi:hypothetical protein